MFENGTGKEKPTHFNARSHLVDGKERKKMENNPWKEIITGNACHRIVQIITVINARSY